ncbi:MAG: hypothetical protein NVS4B10_21380 [Myxococcales bacterium]
MHALVAAALIVAGLARGAGLPGQGQLEASLRQAVSATCPGHPFAVDPDLGRAAIAYATAVRDGRASEGQAALAFFASLEAADPSTSGGVATVAPPGNADRGLGDLLPNSCRFTHAGVAAALLPSGKAVVAVLAAEREVELERIPGQVEPGAAVRIAGRVREGLSATRLYVQGPNGAVEETALPLSRDRRFSGEAVLRAKGEYAVEVLADGAGGPEVIALRRVFAGAAKPMAPPRRVAPRGKGLASVAESIGALRASRGLPPLVRDRALDAVAEVHSRAMASSRTFAHVLPGDGALADRLRAAGYAYRSAGENIGLADTAGAAHEAVALSPAHLANLLDPRYRRLGLGAIRGVSPDGGEAIYLTEVLAAPIGSKDPRADVLRLLAAERKKHRLVALESDPILDAIALSEVRAISLGHSDLKTYGAATKRALAENVSLRSAAADLVVAAAAEEAVSSKNVLEPAWTHVGVGAIYASSKEFGAGRLWVLILYGR